MFPNLFGFPKPPEPYLLKAFPFQNQASNPLKQFFKTTCLRATLIYPVVFEWRKQAKTKRKPKSNFTCHVSASAITGKRVGAPPPGREAWSRRCWTASPLSRPRRGCGSMGLFSVVYFSRGVPSQPKKGKRKGTTGEPRKLWGPHLPPPPPPAKKRPEGVVLKMWGAGKSRRFFSFLFWVGQKIVVFLGWGGTGEENSNRAKPSGPNLGFTILGFCED